MSPEAEMMAAIAAGDQNAYADAVKRYLRLISSYCLRMTGNRGEAEDLTQETFLKLWTHAHSWKPELASVSTWLHRIAHNLCIDFMRRDKSSSKEELNENIPDDFDTAAELDRQALIARLHQALNQLPERQRSALVLNQFQGLSNRDVAAVMDISVEAVESVLARARRTLKQKLHDPDPLKELA
ncbi:MAG: sigma-70 family RNA polymerase sigma factor [Pseudomonadales bacterium]|nr:sigma-70 family RNA polymerase sigma factor [Pseudomonadales bacterium]